MEIQYINLYDSAAELYMDKTKDPIMLPPRPPELEPIKIEKAVVGEGIESYHSYHIVARPPRRDGVIYVSPNDDLIHCLADDQDDILVFSTYRPDEDGILRLKSPYTKYPRMSEQDAGLYWAVNGNACGKAREFIQAGANVNVRNPVGYTALHRASFSKNLNEEIVNLLISAGADVNMGDESGWAPIHRACQYNHVGLARLLLEHGADVNTRGPSGHIPLHLAAWNGNSDVIREILSHGADVDARGAYGRTPLYYACKNNFPDIVRLLISAGADVNAKTESGWTPLHWACRKGQSDIISFLLTAGADPNARNEQRESGFHFACGKGSLDIIRLLLEHGADVNLTDKNGSVPLHYACWHGHADIVRLLIDAGADPHYRNEWGYDPLHYALRYVYERPSFLAIENEGKNKIIDLYKQDYPDSREVWIRSIRFQR